MTKELFEEIEEICVKWDKYYFGNGNEAINFGDVSAILDKHHLILQDRERYGEIDWKRLLELEKSVKK